jgi:hypothetical protein
MYYVYSIRIGNKIYFGQTDNLVERLCKHIDLLERGKHTNATLQSEFNSRGLSGFRFLVEEVTQDREQALKLEQRLIYDCEFCCNVVRHTNRIVSDVLTHGTRQRSVSDTEGRTFPNASTASSFHGVSKNAIRQNCDGITYMLSVGVRCFWTDQGKPPERERMQSPCTGKPVRRSDGEVFSSLSAAAKSVHGEPDKISLCCKGTKKTYRGYGWAFIEN